MTENLNHLGQPVDFDLGDWQTPPPPPREALSGQYCQVVPLEPEQHALDLHQANMLDTEGRNWTYLPYGPFDSLEAYLGWMEETCRRSDPLFFAIIDNASNKAVGVASYLRIDPASGSIEVGHINYSLLLQQKIAATEAMFLMMKQAFSLGYRRYEWKCDALNEKSRAAAQRLGLSFEGIFRQATHYKGRNRDTAWFAAIDQEWPMLEAAFNRWLEPDNFDEQGQQRVRLFEYIEGLPRSKP